MTTFAASGERMALSPTIPVAARRRAAALLSVDEVWRLYAEIDIQVESTDLRWLRARGLAEHRPRHHTSHRFGGEWAATELGLLLGDACRDDALTVDDLAAILHALATASITLTAIQSIAAQLRVVGDDSGAVLGYRGDTAPHLAHLVAACHALTAGDPPPSPARRINVDGIDESWTSTPYTVIPPHTARPIAHLAVEARGWMPAGRDWGSTDLVEVRARCGATMLADRSNHHWSRLCRRCFPATMKDSHG
ncbi:hypothetical protein ACWPN4_22835 [Gordonia polyisoprenivorans]